MTARIEQTEELIEEQTEEKTSYVDIDHLSYSTAKKIYRRGIDYALGTKLGLIEETFGRAAELGTLIHELVLEDKTDWVVSPYEDYRSKAAREWKAEQEGQIVKQDELDTITRTAEAIWKHPLAAELLQSCELEQKLKAKVEGIDFVGYADGISKDRKTLFDLKTTAQFDQFKWQSFRNDFDLQASVYNLFGDKANYYFIVAETVVPYRVQIFGVDEEFYEGGNKKLQYSIEEFHKFRQREGNSDLERISFSVGETNNLANVELLGDFSW